jgi:hypothetical protein
MPWDEIPDELQEAIQMLLEYMFRNPEAKDTLEGIQRCWVPADALSRDLVRRSMQILVRLGWVDETTVAGTILVYSASFAGLSAGREYLDRFRNQ